MYDIGDAIAGMIIRAMIKYVVIALLIGIGIGYGISWLF